MRSRLHVERIERMVAFADMVIRSALPPGHIFSTLPLRQSLPQHERAVKVGELENLLNVQK